MVQGWWRSKRYSSPAVTVSDFNNGGILSGPVDGAARVKVLYPNVEAQTGLVVLHRSSSFRGAVARIEPDGVVLRSTNSGLERVFTMAPGAFAHNGETVTLVRPQATIKVQPQRTASGSVAVAATAAKVAKASRILVEGVHDAELVEKVWGDDLRYEGIVVERLDGLDDVEAVVRSFSPGPHRKLGVLVDHLVPGSKESRLAAAVTSPHVLITGTPYVDVWQAVRPSVLGIEVWPAIPRGQDWKAGICAHFGVAEPGRLWKQLLASVNTFADLEPDLINAVEQLIDFVTTDQ